MSKIISYKDKHVLIIDDMADMRSSLRNQIGSLEITNVGVASSIRDALDLLKQKRYDVILCDYYLGGSTDGQQFLEYLRTAKIISRATLFIMITAETGYESVITAAECLPDDYLLKPFTAETLRSRFQRLMEKRYACTRSTNSTTSQHGWRSLPLVRTSSPPVTNIWSTPCVSKEMPY